MEALKNCKFGKMWKSGKKVGNLEKKNGSLNLKFFFKFIKKWKFEKKCRNFGKNLEIWREYGNFENIWIFGKNRKLEKNGNFKKNVGNLEKNWNLEKIWKFGKYLETIWKFEKH